MNGVKKEKEKERKVYLKKGIKIKKEHACFFFLQKFIIHFLVFFSSSSSKFEANMFNVLFFMLQIEFFLYRKLKVRNFCSKSGLEKEKRKKTL